MITPIDFHYCVLKIYYEREWHPIGIFRLGGHPAHSDPMLEIFIGDDTLLTGHQWNKISKAEAETLDAFGSLSFLGAGKYDIPNTDVIAVVTYI